MQGKISRERKSGNGGRLLEKKRREENDKKKWNKKEKEWMVQNVYAKEERRVGV